MDAGDPKSRTIVRESAGVLQTKMELSELFATVCIVQTIGGLLF
jgi:hypothetical protein